MNDCMTDQLDELLIDWLIDWLKHETAKEWNNDLVLSLYSLKLFFINKCSLGLKKRYYNLKKMSWSFFIFSIHCR